MKTKLISFILLTLTITACIGPRKVYRLINQKDTYIWSNVYNGRQYDLLIDSNERIWFTGRIIIDLNDTLYLKGFEKGNDHPTIISKFPIDNLHKVHLGHISIFTYGYTADTVRINNNFDSISQLPINLKLYKSKKQ